MIVELERALLETKGESFISSSKVPVFTPSSLYSLLGIKGESTLLSVNCEVEESIPVDLSSLLVDELSKLLVVEV